MNEIEEIEEETYKYAICEICGEPYIPYSFDVFLCPLCEAEEEVQNEYENE